VQLNGPETEKKRYEVYAEQETLVIEYKNKDKFFWKKDLFDDDKVKITITMPELKELSVQGAGKLMFGGFREQDIEIKLTGAVNGEGDIYAENLTVELTGASTLELKGDGQFMEANLTGACGLRAYNYQVNHAIVEAQGASSAKVFVTNKLEIDKGVASSVSHRGDAEVITRN
jgi:Putative auto-transporter adhesin, head GIN domain